MFTDRFFIINLDYENLFERFLVSAVATILGVRLFLEVTGYPQIGNSTLHISHMLWGGLFLAAAVGLLLFFLSRATKHLAAIMGGIGFGLFIDELGKFITQDNDYFYKPAFALIYTIFILLYFVFRTYSRYQTVTTKEYLINSLEYLKEAIVNDLDQKEKEQALNYLKKADQRSRVAKYLAQMYANIDAITITRSNFFTQIWHKLQKSYFQIVALPLFEISLSVFFITKSVLLIIDSLGVANRILLYFYPYWPFKPADPLTFSGAAYLFSTLLSGFYAFLGILKLKNNRFLAYRLFKRSVLVAILLAQVFSFYLNQFAAFGGLLFNLLLLVTLNYMLEQEESEKEI